MLLNGLLLIWVVDWLSYRQLSNCSARSFYIFGLLSTVGQLPCLLQDGHYLTARSAEQQYSTPYHCTSQGAVSLCRHVLGMSSP